MESLGPFRIIRPLGEGGMGAVFLGVATEPVGPLHVGEQAAVKCLTADTESARARFDVESAALGTVQYRGLPTLFGHGHDVATDRLWLAMEYIQGESLAQLAVRERAVPEALVRYIGREVALALSALHSSQVIHRDVKPANILLTPDDRVVLVDLGVAFTASIAERQRITRTGGFVGTWLYAAPEQFEGRATEPDARADLYGLGATLFELTTGINWRTRKDREGVWNEQTWQARPTARQVDPTATIPPPAPPSQFLRHLLERMLEEDPALRLGSSQEVADALEHGERSAWFEAERSRVSRTPGTLPAALELAPDFVHVGREQLLIDAETSAGQIFQGRGCVQLVAGPAGVGKSAFVGELMRRLSELAPAPQLLYGENPPGGPLGPAHAIAQALDEHLGTDRVRRTITSILGDTPQLGERLADVIVGGRAASGHTGLDIGGFHTACVRFLHRLAAQTPVVLVLEDLHFAGPDGRGLFLALSAASRRSRLCLIGTMRLEVDPGFEVDLRQQGLAGVVHLEPLARANAERLIEGNPSTRIRFPSLREAVLSSAAGNPFLLLELARQVGGAGRDRTAGATTHGDTIEIPPSLGDLLAARLARLSPEEHDLLEIAACCGVRFDVVGVAAVMAGIESSARQGLTLRVARSLSRLTRQWHVLAADGAGFRFHPPLLQGHVHERIPAAVRRAYHALLATSLERGGGAADRVLEHRIDAGDLEGALRVEDRGMRTLFARHATHRAVDLMLRLEVLSRSADSTRRLSLLLRLLPVMTRAGRSGTCREFAEEAVALATAAGDVADLAQALLCRIEINSRHSAFDAVNRDAGQILSLPGPASARDRGMARALQGLAALHQGRNDEARAHFESAAGTAALEHDPLIQLKVQGNLGLLADRAGQTEKAAGILGRLAEQLERSGAGALAARARANLAYVIERAGDRPRAMDETHRALVLARDSGDRRSESLALGNLGVWEEDRGDLAQALALADACAGLAEEIGDAEARVMAEMNAAALEGLLGAPEASVIRLTVVLEEISAKADEDPYVLSPLLRMRARCHRLAGGLEDARRDAAQAVAVTEDPELRVRALLEARRIEALAGADAAAEALLAQARAEAKEAGVPKLLTETALLSGALPPDGGGQTASSLGRTLPHRGAIQALWTYAEATGEKEARETAQELLAAMLGRLTPERQADLLRTNPALAHVHAYGA